MTTTATETVEITVLAPNRNTETRPYPVGTTVQAIAEDLGLPTDDVQAFDAMGDALTGDDAISAESEVVNFVVRLAGA